MADDVSRRVGAAVRAEMARRGKNQRKLAEHLGLNQTSVSQRLRGELHFTASELVSLAEFLDVPVALFFADAERGAA
jgi:transcriptional regulator with XRE-family HTH domain